MTSNRLKHQARLQEWKGLIQEGKNSGLSVVQWCKEEGTTKTTYYRWERELLSIANASIGTTPKEAITTFAERPAPQQQYRNDTDRSATLHVGEVCVDIYEGMTA